MKGKGILLLYLSMVITIGLWGLAKAIDTHLTFSNALVQTLGLLGIMLLSWTFILATRTKWIEQLMGGLDKAYSVHLVTGGLAFVALANHVSFLILGALPRNLVKLYLFPGSNLSYTLGQLAFYVMLILIGLTLYINLPYRLWKWTHEWMGIVIILGGLHAILGDSDTTYFLPLGIWISAWSITATIAYLYKRFIYYIYPKPVSYSLVNSGAAGDLLILKLNTQETAINFAPGQYGFFSLPTRPRDEHAFSVIAQNGRELTLGIKMYVNFTKELRALKHGSKILVREPFGKFAEKASAPHAVYLAGGIGITPFLSMGMFTCSRPEGRNVLYGT